jgi:hypothetical protein
VDSTWKGVEQWLRQGGAGGEVLLVFENTEDVYLHEAHAEVGVWYHSQPAGSSVLWLCQVAGLSGYPVLC